MPEAFAVAGALEVHFRSQRRPGVTSSHQACKPNYSEHGFILTCSILTAANCRGGNVLQSLTLVAVLQLTLIFKADEDFSKVDENFTVAYYLAGKDEVSLAFCYLERLHEARIVCSKLLST